MNENTDMIRYCLGDTSDLDGMTREEVEEVTYRHRSDAEEALEENIDDACGNVTILGLEYTTSETLKSVDPIAWRCILSEEIAEVDLNDYPSEDTDEDC